MYFIKNPVPQRSPSTGASVATPSDAYWHMYGKWELPEALMGGTEAMREAGEVYLPKFPKESDEAYKYRLHRTFLLNMYKKTIQTIAGLAFLKPVVVNHVPDELKYLEFDADGSGRSITELAYDMAFNSLHYGKGHMIVDFPRVEEAEHLSLGEFQDRGYRPYMSLINPTRLIGWREHEDQGRSLLQQVRYTSSKIVPGAENQWLDKQVHYVYVVMPDETLVYKFDPEVGEEFEVEETIPNSLGIIPIVTSYSQKTAFMMAEPPMLDLAYTNLCHYQSSSDQRNILHVARVPFLMASGFEEDELDNTELSASRMIVSTNSDANIKFVEHSGMAIGAGRNDLKDLEAQMGLMGADLLLGKGVSRQTATARKIDQSESMSILQLTLRSVEQAIEQAYQIAGLWIGVDASEVSVSIGDDMSLANEPNPTNALIALRDSGLLTDEQVVEEGKRHGILSSYFNLSEDRPSNQGEQAAEDGTEAGETTNIKPEEGPEEENKDGEEQGSE